MGIGPSKVVDVVVRGCDLGWPRVGNLGGKVRRGRLGSFVGGGDGLCGLVVRGGGEPIVLGGGVDGGKLLGVKIDGEFPWKIGW